MNFLTAVTTLALLFLSISAFAAEGASPKERLLLCQAVTAELEKSQADMGLDIEACERNSKVSTRLFSEGLVLVEGTLEFNAPERPTFNLPCAVAYMGQAKLENIVGGVACN